MEKEPAHIPQRRGEQDRSKHGSGIVRTGRVLERAERRVAEARHAARAEDLREERVEQFSRKGVEEAVSDVQGEAIDRGEAQEARSEEDVVGQHGGGTAHEHVGECGAGVGGEGGFEEGVEPVHGFGFVGAVAHGHGALDGHG